MHVESHKTYCLLHVLLGWRGSRGGTDGGVRAPKRSGDWIKAKKTGETSIILEWRGDGEETEVDIFTSNRGNIRLNAQGAVEDILPIEGNDATGLRAKINHRTYELALAFSFKHKTESRKQSDFCPPRMYHTPRFLKSAAGHTINGLSCTAAAAGNIERKDWNLAADTISVCVQGTALGNGGTNNFIVIMCLYLGL